MMRLVNNLVRNNFKDLSSATVKRWGNFYYNIEIRHRHKKRSSAELPTFVNLKSNTMKNTMQR